MGTRSKGGSTSPRRSTGSRPSRRRAKASVFSRPTLWVVASLGVFLAASYLFFTAKPYHDPYTRPSPVSVDFWVCPFEINPARRVLHVNQHLRDVFALPGSDEAWVVGDQGTVLHTDDGGWTWQSQENPALVRREPIKGSAPAPENAAGRFPTPFTFASLAEAGPTVRPALTSVFFLHDGRTGWIGGKQPIVWATDDAGKTWNQAFGPTVEYDALIDLHFFDKSVGVGLYPPYLILTTADGGESWIEGLCPPDVVSLSAVDAQHLWAVTLDGEILFSTDAGKSWLTRTTVSPRAGKASQGSGPEDVSRSGSFKVFFADVDHGWAVVDTGRIWRTRDGGASWSGYDLQPLAGRFDVHFANSQKGWIVGGSGLILATIDGGVTWRKQTSGVGEHLLAVDFSDARTGWAVGYSGTILKTTDGGNTWWRQTRDLSRPAPTETPYLWLPGPGYYAMIVVAGLFLVPLYLRREKQPPLTETKSRVAERFASDRPLEAGDPDHLEFRPTALALAKFLRNEDTVPPVTVAVTGKWGTGKSSLMRLVHGDLTKHSFRPVWFNAWHHQKEEQLLASLLENVRSQAVPPWSDPLTRLRFRLRLLSRRVWRYWWIVLVLGILGFAIGHVPVVQRLTGTITFPERQGPEAGEGPASDTASADADHNLPAELAWYSFLIGVIAAVWKGMVVFGVNPASLMVKVSGAAKIQNLTEQVSFRHRFAREFDHVCWALAPRRLVILIDDLDRCRPSNVLDVLEAINFLASSGECFIVAGMEMESVVRCVGFGLRGVAEELEERGENEREGEAPEDRARRLRVRYARRYLEKLINIEVPIPQMTEEQLERLVTFDEVAPDVTPTPPAARGRFRWARGRRRIRLWYQQAPRWLRACLWVTVALGLVLVGYLVGQLTRREDSQSTPAGQSTPNDETGSPDQEGPPPAPPLDT